MRSSDSARVIDLHLNPPSLQDNTADADRLVRALKSRLGADAVHTDLSLARKLPDLLRQWEYQVRCIVFEDRRQWLLLGVMPAGSPSPAAGLAVDLGTSRVVLRLLDMATGDVLGETAFDNPQIEIGPDILARVHHADAPGGLDRLHDLIIKGLNREIAGLCRSRGLTPEDVYLISLAGNTTMTHLFLGLPPKWIIREPYIPAVNRPELQKAAELGLNISPQGRVFVFPNVAAYFGGDLIAGVVYSGMSRADETAILVDVGTNAEVILGDKNWLMACAGAAGPALEGGVTKMGMMAGPGVIDKARIDPETRRIEVHAIDDAPPRGICGSGLIDLAAQLFLSGMIDIRGKFIPEACGDRLTEADGVRRLIVASRDVSATKGDLTLSQIDLDSLIRSKAAMYTILETLTNTVGMNLSDLSTFYVAGTFGSFINPASAIAIGMIPDLPLESYKALGNSSLGGASRVITGDVSLDEIDRIRDGITYIELNVNQDFMNRFSAAKFLPHTDRTRFPSVTV